MRALLLLVVVVLVGVPVAFLDAAPVPKEGGETAETFEWKGEKRNRTVKTLKCGTTTMTFVKVTKGSFMMGSDDKKDKEAFNDEMPAHKVTFTKHLWVAKYPVTKGQFEAFVKSSGYLTNAETNPNGGWGYSDEVDGFLKQDKAFNWRETGWKQTDQHPVVNVTWSDAAAFCDWMSAENKFKSGFVVVDGKWELTNYKTPEGIRLLTEAEYEYASRGGTDTVYLIGDKVENLKGYANIADESAKKKWMCSHGVGFDDGEPFTSPVDKYKPNAFGLHEMSGNVLCWCADRYNAKLYKRDEIADPGANEDGDTTKRVMRGSNWFAFLRYCRAACRANAPADYFSSYAGFRVCVTLD